MTQPVFEDQQGNLIVEPPAPAPPQPITESSDEFVGPPERAFNEFVGPPRKEDLENLPSLWDLTVTPGYEKASPMQKLEQLDELAWMQLVAKEIDDDDPGGLPQGDQEVYQLAKDQGDFKIVQLEEMSRTDPLNEKAYDNAIDQIKTQFEWTPVPSPHLATEGEDLFSFRLKPDIRNPGDVFEVSIGDSKWDFKVDMTHKDGPGKDLFNQIRDKVVLDGAGGNADRPEVQAALTAVLGNRDFENPILSAMADVGAASHQAIGEVAHGIGSLGIPGVGQNKGLMTVAEGLRDRAKPIETESTFRKIAQMTMKEGFKLTAAGGLTGSLVKTGLAKSTFEKAASLALIQTVPQVGNFYTEAFNHFEAEGIENPEGAALMEASVRGVAVLASEAVLGGIIFGKVGNAVLAGSGGRMFEALSSPAKKAIVALVAEGGTEAIQEAVDIFVTDISRNEENFSAELENLKKVMVGDAPITDSQIATSATVGSILGAGAGSVMGQLDKNQELAVRDRMQNLIPEGIGQEGVRKAAKDARRRVGSFEYNHFDPTVETLLDDGSIVQAPNPDHIQFIDGKFAIADPSTLGKRFDTRGEAELYAKTRHQTKALNELRRALNKRNTARHRENMALRKTGKATPEALHHIMSQEEIDTQLSMIDNSFQEVADGLGLRKDDIYHRMGLKGLMDYQPRSGSRATSVLNGTAGSPAITPDPYKGAHGWISKRAAGIDKAYNFLFPHMLGKIPFVGGKLDALFTFPQTAVKSFMSGLAPDPNAASWVETVNYSLATMTLNFGSLPQQLRNTLRRAETRESGFENMFAQMGLDMNQAIVDEVNEQFTTLPEDASPGDVRQAQMRGGASKVGQAVEPVARAAFGKTRDAFNRVFRRKVENTGKKGVPIGQKAGKSWKHRRLAALTRQAMGGKKKAFDQLPMRLKKIVERSREALDGFSKHMIDSGQMDGGLAKKFGDNLGSYMLRNYKVFDPSYKWTFKSLKENHPTIFDDAVKEIEGTLAMNPFEAEEVLSQIMDADRAKGFLFGTHSEAKINTSSFVQKQELSPAMRKALGEIRDPAQNLVDTGARLSGVWNAFQHQQDMAKILIQSGIGRTSKQGRHTERLLWETVPREIQQMDSKGKETSAKTVEIHRLPAALSGFGEVWVTPEMQGAFKQHYNPDKALRGATTALDLLLKSLSTATVLGKSMQVLANPVSYATNLIGATATEILNGRVGPKGAAKAFDTLFRAVGGKTGPAYTPTDQEAVYSQTGKEFAAAGGWKQTGFEGFFNEAAFEGLIDSAVFGRDVVDTVDRSFLKDFKPVSGTIALLGKAYQQPDNMAKMNAFHYEVSKHVKAYPNRDMKTNIQNAAMDVRATTQNYDMVPHALKFMSQHGLVVPTYVSFSWELMRNTVNTGKLAGKEILEGHLTGNNVLLAHGYKRLAGSMTVLGAAYGLMSMDGEMEDEEMAAWARSYQAEWDQDKAMSVLSYEQNSEGEYEIVHMNPEYLIPQIAMVNIFADGLTETLQGNPIDGAKAVAQGFWTQNSDMNILARTISELLIGEKVNGAKIHEEEQNEASDPSSKHWDYLKHYIDSVMMPGFLRTRDKILKAEEGEVGYMGSTATMDEVNMSALGIRAQRTNMKKAMRDRLAQLPNRFQDVGATATETALRALSPEPMAELLAKEEMEKNRLLREAMVIYQDGMTINHFSDRQGFAAWQSAGLSRTVFMEMWHLHRTENPDANIPNAPTKPIPVQPKRR